MRTEDGDIEAGDLFTGSYGAMEADLGPKLRPLAGFGRDLDLSEAVEEGFDPLDYLEIEPGGVQTSPGAVIYQIRGDFRGG